MANKFDPSLQAAQAALPSTPIVTNSHPTGAQGARVSLNEVAKRILRGRNDPRVNGWAGRALKHKAGCPYIQSHNNKCNCGGNYERTYTREQGQAILDAMRAQTMYVQDPVNTEMMKQPSQTLCLDENGLCMPAGDCFQQGTLLLRNDFALVPIEDIKVGEFIWGRDAWTRVENKWPKGALFLSLIHLNNGSQVLLTPDHKVYRAVCDKHAGYEPVCACGIEERRIERVHVKELVTDDVLIRPERLPFGSATNHPRPKKIDFQGPPRNQSLLRVIEVEHGMIEDICYDIATEDHYVYLPEHDVTVSNCDDRVITFGSAMMSIGVPVKVIGQCFDGGKVPTHVMCAIQDAKTGEWYKVDPSSKYDVGKAYPATHEDWIDPLDMYEGDGGDFVGVGNTPGEFVGVGRVPNGFYVPTVHKGTVGSMPNDPNQMVPALYGNDINELLYPQAEAAFPLYQYAPGALGSMPNDPNRMVPPLYGNSVNELLYPQAEMAFPLYQYSPYAQMYSPVGVGQTPSAPTATTDKTVVQTVQTAIYTLQKARNDLEAAVSAVTAAKNLLGAPYDPEPATAVTDISNIPHDGSWTLSMASIASSWMATADKLIAAGKEALNGARQLLLYANVQDVFIGGNASDTWSIKAVAQSAADTIFGVFDSSGNPVNGFSAATGANVSAAQVQQEETAVRGTSGLPVGVGQFIELAIASVTVYYVVSKYCAVLETQAHEATNQTILKCLTTMGPNGQPLCTPEQAQATLQALYAGRVAYMDAKTRNDEADPFGHMIDEIVSAFKWLLVGGLVVGGAVLAYPVIQEGVASTVASMRAKRAAKGLVPA